MIRVVHCTFTASAHIAAQNNAPELLDELAELAARAEVMAQHPGFAANTMRQLGLYCIPSILIRGSIFAHFSISIFAHREIFCTSPALRLLT